MDRRARLQAVKDGEKNVGGVERLLRGTVGPALVLLGVAAFAGLVSLAGGVVGLALAGLSVLAGARMTQTAFTQRCYMNAVIGRNSCRVSTPAGEPATE